jgi:hypothetical protein
MRLALGLPTPDVIDRAVRVALRENSSVVIGLISRNLPSDVLIEIGSIAISDVQARSLRNSHELFDQLFVGRTSGQIDGRQSSDPAPVGRHAARIFRSFYGGEPDLISAVK